MFDLHVKERRDVWKPELKSILHPRYLAESDFKSAFELYGPYSIGSRFRDFDSFKHAVICGDLVVHWLFDEVPVGLGIYDDDGKLVDDIPIFMHNIEEEAHEPIPVYSIVEQARKIIKDVHLRPWQEYEAEQAQTSSGSYEPIRDEELAKSEGASPEQVEARKRIAKDFLVSNGFAEAQIDTAIGSEDGTVDGGFDLTKPVVVTSFPPPEQMSQYVASHGYPGNWFDPLGTQPATALGISDEGRTQKAFIVPEGKGLQGSSKPILDTWTNSDNPVQTEGGGTQLFVNNDVRNEFIKLNNIGEK